MRVFDTSLGLVLISHIPIFDTSLLSSLLSLMYPFLVSQVTVTWFWRRMYLTVPHAVYLRIYVTNVCTVQGVYLTRFICLLRPWLVQFRPRPRSSTTYWRAVPTELNRLWMLSTADQHCQNLMILHGSKVALTGIGIFCLCGSHCTCPWPLVCLWNYRGRLLTPLIRDN